jgi:hypothetical protein
MQQQHRLPHGHRQPAARQRDEAPVDDREYVHEQPAAQPGPRERLRQLVKRRLVLLRAESLLHRPRLAQGITPPSGRVLVFTMRVKAIQAWQQD